MSKKYNKNIIFLIKNLPNIFIYPATQRVKQGMETKNPSRNVIAIR